MKIIIKVSLFIIIGLFIVISVIKIFEYNGNKYPNKKESANSEVDGDDAITNTPIWTNENQKELDSLMKIFNKKEDEFNNITWLENKNIPVLATNLHCVVNMETPYIYLVSMYYGDDWLFHEKIQIKYGDSIVSSNKVPSFDPRNATANSGGSVWEIISFSNGDDNEIPKFIYMNFDKPIKVRLLGRQYYKDYTLSNNYKKMIKESYQLFELLKLKKSADVK